MKANRGRKVPEMTGEDRMDMIFWGAGAVDEEHSAGERDEILI
jgi:hypothetical protein